jgi:hypothetical protein
MATQDDVRRIALSFPGARQEGGHFAFSVLVKGKDKGFAWVWLERVHPKKARVPQPKVLAVRVADLSQKDMLIASDPDTYFTEPHYNGFPAVLVRLAAIGVDELEALLLGAWQCQAPEALRAQLESVPRAAKAKRAPRGAPKKQPGARGSKPRRAR